MKEHNHYRNNGMLRYVGEKQEKKKKKQVVVFTFNDSGPLQAKTTSQSLKLHALEGNIRSG